VEAAIVVLVTFLLLAAVLRFVGAPLRAARRAHGAGGDVGGEAQDGDGGAGEAARARARRETLEAAREAKYREIRDADLDYRTGKLSRADYEGIDATLRAEAIEILDRLDPPEMGGEGGAFLGADAEELEPAEPDGGAAA
jgi:hypothetical protein